MTLCPCGSGLTLQACCGPVMDAESATTAEALMRSRYTAFVLQRTDYLLHSWHPDSRPSRIRFDDTRWLGLSIIGTDRGQAGDIEGTVEFQVAFICGGECRVLHEISRFERLDNRWLYRDGDCRIDEPGRNAPCPCGSGRKFKRCCALPGKPGG